MRHRAVRKYRVALLPCLLSYKMGISSSRLPQICESVLSKTALRGIFSLPKQFQVTLLIFSPFQNNPKYLDPAFR